MFLNSCVIDTPPTPPSSDAVKTSRPALTFCASSG